MTLDYIKLHYITLNYITLHSIHYITLHYTTLHSIHTYICNVMCDVRVLEIRIQLRVKMVKVDPFLWGYGQHVWMTLKFDLWLDLYGLQSDWWYTYPSEKNMKVSWDYYSQYMEKTR